MKRIKLALAISALMVSSSVLADLNTGLMAYYNFDACSANDTSGNNNNGTINGNLSCVTGTVNKALQFDGASYINVPSNITLNPSKQFTMSFWIHVDEFTNVWSAIIHKGGGDTGSCYENREYSLWLRNGGSYLWQSAGGDNSCDFAFNSKKIQKGKWFHYVGIIDRSKHIMSIYINGKLNAKKVDNYNTFNTNNDDLQIGSTEQLDATISPFKGALDEIRLYNRVLTVDEITALYNQGVPPLPLSGVVNRLNKHTVTCANNTTKQSIVIPANKVTTYDCEAKGLQVKPTDNVTITINGNVQ